jgi:D-3-phosphoglycerate dehydrogenase
MTKLAKLPVKIAANALGRPLQPQETIDFLRATNATVAVIGMEEISEQTLSALPTLKYIAKYGVGLDNIDFAAAAKYNIDVGFGTGVNKRSVSEMVLSFALGHARNIFRNTALMKQGVWEKNGGRQLTGSTVGIVGFGNVGQDVAHLLTPFTCNVLACDIEDRAAAAKKHGVKMTAYQEILATADVITLHVPLTEKTRSMFGESEIKLCKKQPLLINTARGKVVDFDAVIAGVRNGKLGGYAADVYGAEPADVSQFKDDSRLNFTAHIGGNAREAVQAMGEAAIAAVAKYLAGL